jgi:Flp pilus assembly protein TadG
VETALVAPVLIFLTLLVADVGRGFYYREAVTNAARQAMRVAVNSAQQGTGNNYCGGDHSTTQVPDSASDNLKAIATAAALESTSDGTAGGSRLSNSANPTILTVTWHCQPSTKAMTNAVANTNPAPANTDPNDPTSASIKVKVDYTFSFITPLAANIIGSPNIHIIATEYARAEY